MESYSPIIVLIVNVLRTLLVKKAMDIFLSLDDVEKKSLKIGLGVYCMLTTIVYSMFHDNAYLFLSGNLEKEVMGISCVIQP